MLKVIIIMEQLEFDVKLNGKIEQLKQIIAPHILDVGVVPLIKEALVYQLFADRMSFLVIGSVSSGSKSSYTDSLSMLVPDNFDYVSSEKLTNAGLIYLARMHNDWLLICVDEFDKIPREDKNSLLSIGQKQRLKIVKHKVNKIIKAPFNIFAVGNPKGNNNEWIQFGNVEQMREQMPDMLPMLRRFHFNIFAPPYTASEFRRINEFKINRFNREISYPEDFIIKFNSYIEEARQIKINITEDDLPKRFLDFLDSARKYQSHIVPPITNELTDGIVNTAIARARIRHDNKVSEEDWSAVMIFLTKCLATGGLTPHLVRKLRKNI